MKIKANKSAAKQREIISKSKNTIKPTKAEEKSVGPWASVTSAEAKIVAESVQDIMDIAVQGKFNTDGGGDGDVTVDDLIFDYLNVATSALTCLLLLAPTRSREDQKAGPLADVSQEDANIILEGLKFAFDLGRSELRRVKKIKKLHLIDFFGGFSFLKKHAGYWQGVFCPDDEND